MEKSNVEEIFFDYEETDYLYKCKIEVCKSRLKGPDSSLRRHIAQQHPLAATQIGLKGYTKNMQHPSPNESKPSKKTENLLRDLRSG